MSLMEKFRISRRGRALQVQIPGMRAFVKSRMDEWNDSVRRQAARRLQEERERRRRQEEMSGTVAAEKERTESGRETAQQPEQRTSSVQFSLQEIPFDDGDRITDMERFRSAAKKDPSLYSSEAISKTYRNWERNHAELKSFSSEVVRIAGEKYDRPSAFYHFADIDKRIYHRMKTEFDYKPFRETALRCCAGLRLSGEEADELLRLAGMFLSPCHTEDLVFRFCLDHGIWDRPGIDYMLAAQMEDN